MKRSHLYYGLLNFVDEVWYLSIMLNGEIVDETALRVLKALASEPRLLILAWLQDPAAHFPPQSNGDFIRDGVCADFIRAKLGITAAAASRHLTILTDVDLLRATRRKGWTYYRRNEPRIQYFLEQLHTLLSV